MADLKKFISGENLVKYDEIIKAYIGTEDAKSIKSITVSGNTVSFFKTEDASGTAAYTVNIPDVSGFMSKIASANGGKIVTSLATGEVSESNTAISDLATNAFVGAIPAGATATTVTGYVDEAVGEVASDLSTLDNSLAAVAKSGDAADVSYDNTTSGLTATNVQAAIDEVAEASAGGVDSKTVYFTETAGQSGDAFSKRYSIYQGATGSSLSPVVAEKLADIDIPKDMVVESGSVGTVETADVPYEGAQVGDKYIDLVIANATSDHIYIPVNSLVDIYTVEQNATQIQLAINNNVISATIVDGAVTTAKIADGNVTKAKLASGVQASLDLADSAVQSVTESDATTGTNGTITVDGTEVAVKGLGSAAYTASTAYDASGAAAAVLGESTDTSSANTVYGAKKYTDDAYNAITSYTDAEIEALFA